MKILAIGDPHGELEKIKKIPIDNIDLILLTGDLGSASLMRKMYFENVEREKMGEPKVEYTPAQEKEAFMESYDSTIALVEYLAKRAPVATIFGNVESSNPATRKLIRKFGLDLPLLSDDLSAMNNVRVINNRIMRFGSLRIGGLNYFIDPCWVKEFKVTGDLVTRSCHDVKTFKRILDNFGALDILVCHQPPYGILDKVTSQYAPKHWIGKHAGSKLILDYVKKSKPRFVFCGHIHEDEGEALIGRTRVYNLGVANYRILET